MKFKFPLQAVQRHRKILEEQAQRYFQEANSILNQEITKLEGLYDQVKAAREHAFKTQVQGGGTTGHSLTQVAEFLKGQDIRIERQKEIIKNQQQIVEDLREILRKAAIDHKIIEKYREKKFEEFKLELRKEEQKEIDEIVQTRTLIKVDE